MEELRKKEEKLERELMANYIIYASQLIAKNIKCIYNCYGDDYLFSLDDIIRFSKDDYVMSKDENDLFYRLIKEHLRDKYRIEIVSINEEKLKIKEL